MKIKIEEIYSKNMFPGLIIGKPKDGDYDISLKNIKDLLGNDIQYPIQNLSKTEWKQITENYGSYGHIAAVKLRIVEDYDNYNFSIIFNFYPEIERLEKVIKRSIDSIDWRNCSFKWDIGDL